SARRPAAAGRGPARSGRTAPGGRRSAPSRAGPWPPAPGQTPLTWRVPPAGRVLRPTVSGGLEHESWRHLSRELSWLLGKPLELLAERLGVRASLVGRLLDALVARPGTRR